MIEPYLRDLGSMLEETLDEAIRSIAPISITYAYGRCNMAANRDYYDDERNLYATGYNPDEPADDTLVAARIANADGKTRLSFVHYACHPTTLAWENTLLSPDFVGAARQVVEDATSAPVSISRDPAANLAPKTASPVTWPRPTVTDGNSDTLPYPPFLPSGRLKRTTSTKDLSYPAQRSHLASPRNRRQAKTGSSRVWSHRVSDRPGPDRPSDTRPAADRPGSVQSGTA